MASPRADLWTSLAGPATHVAWLALVLPPYFLLDVRTRPEDWAWMANGFVQMNVALLVFNLLPFYPLDGGRALRAMLASRMHVSKASWFCAWVGYAGALLIGLAGIWSTIQGDALLGRLWGPVMIALAVTSFLACRQLQAEARHAIEGPYEPVEPWAGSLPGDSWREPVQDPVDREEERRRRQAAEEERREREFRRRLRERIDELLDRINEVGGVENLSPDERRELAEASELLRRETAER